MADKDESRALLLIDDPASDEDYEEHGQRLPRHREDVCVNIDETNQTLQKTYIVPIGADGDDGYNAVGPAIQQNVVPLAEGKEYHLFISYNIVDSEWVQHVVETLEAAPYHLKCAFHERDFRAGKSTIENIGHFMAVSMKMIPILSPDYLDSNWCVFEQRMAHDMSMAQKKDFMLPVLYRDCGIPDSMKTLTYITADRYDMFERIYQALNQDAEGMMTPRRYIQDHLVRNGTTVEIPSVPSAQRNSWEFHDLNMTQKEQVDEIGVRMTDETWRNIIEVINASTPLNHPCFRCFFSRMCHISSGWCYWWISATIFSMCWLTAYFALPIEIHSSSIKYIFYGCMLLPWPLLFLTAFIPCALKFLAKKKHNEEINKLNLDFGKINGFAIILRQPAFPILAIIKYDIERCERFFFDQLQDERFEQGEQIRDFKALVFEISRQEYFPKLMNKTLDVAVVTRPDHQVVSGYICLCQYAEKTFWIMYNRRKLCLCLPGPKRVRAI